MHDIFDLNPAHADPKDAILILVTTANEQFVLMVDTIIGQSQVVIRDLKLDQLGSRYKYDNFRGGAIMGHGGVALVLETENLVNYL